MPFAGGQRLVLDGQSLDGGARGGVIVDVMTDILHIVYILEQESELFCFTVGIFQQNTVGVPGFHEDVPLGLKDEDQLQIALTVQVIVNDTKFDAIHIDSLSILLGTGTGILR